MKQKTRSKEEWRKLVGEYRESGKSLREWCSERGINQSTMSNHTPLYPHTKKPQNVHRSEGEWIALIQEQRNSGKSRERWCDENNINHKSMGSAVKRYANRLENINNRQEICESKPLNNKEIFGEPFLKSDNPNCRAEQFCEQTKGVRNAEQTTKPSWIEIGIESEMNQEKAERLEEPDSRERTQRVCEMISKTSEHHKPQAEIEEKKSKIKIRFGKLEIEADDGYPSSHLENLIGLVIRLTADCSPLQSGKLVAVC